MSGMRLRSLLQRTAQAIKTTRGGVGDGCVGRSIAITSAHLMNWIKGKQMAGLTDD